LKQLVFELPADAETTTASVSIGGQPLAATVRQEGRRVVLSLEAETTVVEGQAVDVSFVLDSSGAQPS
jgi:hypothetical protein